MQSVTVESLTEIVAATINQRLTLQGIDWDYYEEVLSKFENSNALHFAYDDGFLEIEMPTEDHEKAAYILLKLIEFLCLEWEIETIGYGSTTLRQREKAKGVEPDASFYVQNEEKVRGKIRLDLQKDPPPDLVIEADVTSPSLDKMPIYAALGVPEIWIYKNEPVKFYRLNDDKYLEIENSVALPFLSSAKTKEFLLTGFTESSLKWTRTVRDWAREQIEK